MSDAERLLGCWFASLVCKCAVLVAGIRIHCCQKFINFGRRLRRLSDPRSMLASKGVFLCTQRKPAQFQFEFRGLPFLQPVTRSQSSKQKLEQIKNPLRCNSLCIVQSSEKDRGGLQIRNPLRRTNPNLPARRQAPSPKTQIARGSRHCPLAASVLNGMMQRCPQHQFVQSLLRKFNLARHLVPRQCSQLLDRKYHLLERGIALFRVDPQARLPVRVLGEASVNNKGLHLIQTTWSASCSTQLSLTRIDEGYVPPPKPHYHRVWSDEHAHLERLSGGFPHTGLPVCLFLLFFFSVQDDGITSNFLCSMQTSQATNLQWPRYAHQTPAYWWPKT